MLTCCALAGDKQERRRIAHVHRDEAGNSADKWVVRAAPRGGACEVELKHVIVSDGRKHQSSC